MFKPAKPSSSECQRCVSHVLLAMRLGSGQGEATTGLAEAHLTPEMLSLAKAARLHRPRSGFDEGDGLSQGLGSKLIKPVGPSQPS